MPWQEVCYMEQRMRFITAVLNEEDSMAALCEEYGVSRKTGYKWLERYQEHGPAGLEDRSHAPHVVPWAISQAQQEAIIGLRCEHPSWGPKKLRSKLAELAPQQSWPALSTISDLLKRHGLSQARKRRRCATPSPGNMHAPVGSNDLWGIDFKGWFRTRDGARCDPLTVSDAFSRYLLCAQGLARPDYQGCRSALERVFREYGLPRTIRSDNGAPFASLGAGGLSRLSVWWVKLGIVPERIEPGKPEQNGRHERMHRTLKAECASPPPASLCAQQRRFDRFREEFNRERPHEALGQTPPALHYQPSPRAYPARLEDPLYPADYELRRVRQNGDLKWCGEAVFIGEALSGEVVGVLEDDDGNGRVYFGPIPLGMIDAITFKLRRPTP
jgi:putative transposase